MNTRRATPDELLPHIIKFVGSSGGGQWSFQLPCKSCRDLGTVSAARDNIGKPKALRKAAEAFTEQGWWIDDLPKVLHTKRHMILNYEKPFGRGNMPVRLGSLPNCA
jgi:hypothetical protein